MYSSLDRIDLIATSKQDGVATKMLVQTDHRMPEEIETVPEVSVLFALARVINARQIMSAERQKPGAHGPDAAEAKATPDDDADLRVIYGCIAEPPDFLIDALASVDAWLEIVGQGDGGKTLRSLGGSDRAPEDIANECFAGLAAKVRRRVGLSDNAAALRALEAEICADPPRKDADEARYWIGIIELTAVAIEVIRAQYRGHWVISDKAVLPFGFEVDTGGSAGIMFPSNRAQRLIEDGASESMFHLVGSLDELINRASFDASGAILPSLRALSEVRSNNLVYQELGLGVEDPSRPVIAYGRDGDNTFGLFSREGNHDPLDDLHAQALHNLAKLEPEVEEFAGADLLPANDLYADVRVLSLGGNFFATEALLNPAFLREMHAHLDCEVLVGSAPRRGQAFITRGDDSHAIKLLFILTKLSFEGGGGRAISPMLMMFRDADLVGVVRLTEEDDTDDASGTDDDADGRSDDDDDDETDDAGGETDADENGDKKPGFFRRLFKRS